MIFLSPFLLLTKIDWKSQGMQEIVSEVARLQKGFRGMSFGVLKKTVFYEPPKIAGESGLLFLGVYIIDYMRKACVIYN